MTSIQPTSLAKELARDDQNNINDHEENFKNNKLINYNFTVARGEIQLIDTSPQMPKDGRKIPGRHQYKQPGTLKWKVQAEASGLYNG